MMGDNYLGKAHKYFNLSDYEVDPQSRYRKRIFHDRPAARATRSPNECEHCSHSHQPFDLTVHPHRRIADNPLPRLDEIAQRSEYAHREAHRKRQRERSVDGYGTDGSFIEVPPMSPSSTTASVFDGIDDTGDETDSANVSDSEKDLHPTPARLDLKGKESMPPPPPKLPNSFRLLPKIVTNPVYPPKPLSASSSITEYSNSRLAERARLASLPANRSPEAIHAATTERAITSKNTSQYPYPAMQKTTRVEYYRDRTISTRSGELFPDSSLASRARRATISGTAMNVGSSHDSQAAKQKPVTNSVFVKHEAWNTTMPPRVEKVKLERSSPPAFDLNVEQLSSEFHFTEPAEASSFAAPAAEYSRRRKRSKSSPIVTKDGETPVPAEPDPPIKPFDKSSTTSQILRKALDSGDYVQVSNNGWTCKVHGDHLGGPRSVTRHHQSVHLNLTSECEYCSAQFSRRDAVLRHQRHSSCTTNRKQKEV